MSSLRLTTIALSLLAAASAFVGCEASADLPETVSYPGSELAAEIDVRFEGYGEAALIVPVFVNGMGPYDFILDTGATMTCLARPVADELQIERKRNSRGVGAGVEGTSYLELVRLENVRVGGSSAGGLTACILDLDHMSAVGVEVQGLLGLNFLRAFHMTVNFDDRVLSLQRP